VAGILESVLKGDVFIGDVALDAWAFDGRWRRLCGDGCLLGRRSVVGVLEDSLWSLAGRAGR